GGPAGRRRAAGAAVAGRRPLRYRPPGPGTVLAGRIRRPLAWPRLPRRQRPGRQQRPGGRLGAGPPARPHRPGRGRDRPGRARRPGERSRAAVAGPARPGRRRRGRPRDPARPGRRRRARPAPAPEPGLMSLILDALRKAESERQRGQAPDLFAAAPPQPAGAPRPWRAWGGYALAGLLAVALAFLVWRQAKLPATPVTGEAPA